jgi:hypothetical protein
MSETPTKQDLHDNVLILLEQNRIEILRLINEHNMHSKSTITPNMIRAMRKETYTKVDKYPLGTEEDLTNANELIRIKSVNATPLSTSVAK